MWRCSSPPQVFLLPYVQHHVQRFNAQERARVMQKHLSMRSILRRHSARERVASLEGQHPAEDEAGTEPPHPPAPRQHHQQARSLQRRSGSYSHGQGGGRPRVSFSSGGLEFGASQRQPAHPAAEAAFFSPLTKHLQSGKQPGGGALGWGGGLAASRRREPGEADDELTSSSSGGKNTGSANGGGGGGGMSVSSALSTQRAAPRARHSTSGGGSGRGGRHRLAVCVALTSPTEAGCSESEKGSPASSASPGTPKRGHRRLVWSTLARLKGGSSGGNSGGGAEPGTMASSPRGGTCGEGAERAAAPAVKQARQQQLSMTAERELSLAPEGALLSAQREPSAKADPPQQPGGGSGADSPGGGSGMGSAPPSPGGWMIAAGRPPLPPLRAPASPGAPSCSSAGATPTFGGNATATSSSQPASPFRFGLSEEERSVLRVHVQQSSGGGGGSASEAGTTPSPLAPWSSDGAGIPGSTTGGGPGLGTTSGGFGVSGGFGASGSDGLGFMGWALPSETRLRFGLPTEDSNECVFEIPVSSDSASLQHSSPSPDAGGGEGAGGGGGGGWAPPGGSGPCLLRDGGRTASSFLRMIRRSYSTGPARSNLGRASSSLDPAKCEAACAEAAATATEAPLGVPAFAVAGGGAGVERASSLWPEPPPPAAAAGGSPFSHAESGGEKGWATVVNGEGGGEQLRLSEDFKVLCIGPDEEEDEEGEEEGEGSAAEGPAQDESPREGPPRRARLRVAGEVAGAPAPDGPAVDGSWDGGASALRKERAELRQRLRIIKSVSDLSRSSLSSGSSAAVAAACAAVVGG
jgi:hypothetical protein